MHNILHKGTSISTYVLDLSSTPYNSSTLYRIGYMKDQTYEVGTLSFSSFSSWSSAILSSDFFDSLIVLQLWLSVPLYSEITSWRTLRSKLSASFCRLDSNSSMAVTTDRICAVSVFFGSETEPRIYSRKVI